MLQVQNFTSVYIAILYTLKPDKIVNGCYIYITIEKVTKVGRFKNYTNPLKSDKIEEC